MFEISKFKLWDWILLVIFLLFLMDLSVIFNIPFLRPAFTFLFLTFIPGILILQILRLNKIELLKKMVLWVGLSLAFLMITGIILNTLYPILITPLSLIPVLITLNIFIILLSVIVYLRNSATFNESFGDYKFSLDDKLYFPLIFPFIFPILAVLGTYLMNISQNNILLLIMLLLIPLYLIVVVVLRDRIHPATYAFALWLIGLSLLLMQGLTSSNLMGRDVHEEYYCFQLVQYYSHWDLNNYYNSINACLSVTILPQVYQVISGLGGEYVFKLFMALIGSVTPLIVYLVARKYLVSKYAFLGALLFIFQLFFLSLLGAVRQEIATIFFFLAVLVIFDFEMSKWPRKLLIIIFLFSMLISHYSTAYVAFILILPILLWPFFDKLIRERRLDFTNFDLILISLALIIIWYVLVAKVQFASGAEVVAQTVQTAASSGGVSTSSLVSTRGAYVLGVLGVVLKNLPNTVSVIANDLIFATIILGLLGILRKYRYYHEKFKMQFLIGIIISIALLILFVTLPYISIAYDVVRLFFQLIIFLAPVFVIGGIVISRLIKKPKWDVYVLLILLLFLFTCVTYLQYSALGEPYSPYYENNSIIRQEEFIYNSELVSAQWLYQNRVDNLTIYSDGSDNSRFLTAYGNNINNVNLNGSFFGWNQSINQGYIYLGYVNVNNNQVIDIDTDIIRVDIKPYSNLFKGKSIIYDDGGSQIWW